METCLSRPSTKPSKRRLLPSASSRKSSGDRVCVPDHSKSVEIPVRKSGRPSGFAFLHFDTAEEVSDAAEKLKDLEVEGLKLRVSAARTAEEQAAVTEKKNAAREGAAKKREAKVRFSELLIAEGLC